MMMVIMMNDSKLNSMAQIKRFLAETKEIEYLIRNPKRRLIVGSKRP